MSEKEQKRGNVKSTIGIVLSAKMDKSLVVGVTTLVKHKLYQKFIKRTKKYYVHDEKNEAQEGSKVRIIETKPVSKLKRWRLLEVIEK